MKIIKTCLLLLIAFTIALTAVTAFYQPPALHRDAPRPLPWTLPDYRKADSHWHVDAQGRIHNQVEHFFLEGITPDMVAWFYQQLPISTVELNGETYPLYHIFHPTEHGRIQVVKPAPDGTPGIAKGAIIMREEWFGPFDSKGAALMTEFSNAGMVAIPKVADTLEIGRVEHVYQAEAGGTRYRVNAIIGSDLPVLGRVINAYLRARVFHPELMAQWQRHQIEEVASLQFFLPALYAQRHNRSNHFQLTISE
ncbi:MAG: hypothetical protein AseanaTS_16450 [Candidatus Pelagadaptatus aseana]|uniref:hypothetical protein n=1 Tax=Candidatus Pelagadaptatus aseana TaxID=3120508 RepID=UPI0039B160ED